MPDTTLPISVVCSDLSENCLGRAQVLAEVLAELGPVSIVGPQLSAAIWRPALSSPIPLRGVAMKSGFSYPKAAAWLRGELRGSKVVVSKPRATSFGLALMAGVSPAKMALDIDDWELGFKRTPGGTAKTPSLLSRGIELLAPSSLNSYGGIHLLDELSKKVPRRIVSNSWLEERFGGVVVPHVRNTDALDPARFVEAIASRRQQQGMDGRSWVGFIGTIREHKGVEDLVAAVAMLSGPSAPGLLLAGVDFEHAFSKAILAQARQSLPEERLRIVGAFDGAELPSWVGAADIICIPSRDTPGGVGQIPAKLFDGMSMARPVVASNVNDMRSILEGCGATFPAGDVAALSAELARLSTDSGLSARLGQAARARAIAQFSVKSARLALRGLIDGLPAFLPSA